MMRFRALALVAVPALLVGSATPTLATEDSGPTSATTSPTCGPPAVDAVVTAADSLRLAEACRTAAQAPAWHWMGNYGSVYEVQDAANGFGVGAGGLITQGDANGLFPTFMYY